MTFVITNCLTIRKLIPSWILKQDKNHFADFAAQNHGFGNKKPG
jgi:hypothetical protein